MQSITDADVERSLCGKAQLLLKLRVSAASENALGHIRRSAHVQTDAQCVGGDFCEVDETGEDACRKIESLAVFHRIHGREYAGDAIVDMDEVPHLTATTPDRHGRVVTALDRALANARERISIVLVFAVT